MNGAGSSRRIRVAGAGLVGPLPEDPRSIPEMVFAAVQAAYAEAGLGHAEVDAVVTASVDLLDGLTASNIAVTEVVDAVMKPETRIAADGLAAALHAAAQIRSGTYDTVLVVAHAKASMADYQGLTRWAMDPVHLQPLGLDFLASAGLQAGALAPAEPSAERRWAELVAARRRGRPSAFAVARDTEGILLSPLVAAPIRSAMCAPFGDAACAVILSAAPRAGEIAAVHLAGEGWDLEPHDLGERDLRCWNGLARAWGRACAAAGIEPHDAELDFAEPSCLYPHEEELFRLALGLGEAIPLSPGGGLFGGTAPVVAGLSRLAAAADRLRAGEGRRAVAHGHWGPAGQAQAIAILEAAS